MEWPEKKGSTTHRSDYSNVLINILIKTKYCELWGRPQSRVWNGTFCVSP